MKGKEMPDKNDLPWPSCKCLSCDGQGIVNAACWVPGSEDETIDCDECKGGGFVCLIPESKARELWEMKKNLNEAEDVFGKGRVVYRLFGRTVHLEEENARLKLRIRDLEDAKDEAYYKLMFGQ